MESDSARGLLLQITESVRWYVESLQEGGVTELPRAATPSQGETEKSEQGKASSAPRFPDCVGCGTLTRELSSCLRCTRPICCAIRTISGWCGRISRRFCARWGG